jgi:hypothetical protein
MVDHDYYRTPLIMIYASEFLTRVFYDKCRPEGIGAHIDATPRCISVGYDSYTHTLRDSELLF